MTGKQTRIVIVFDHDSSNVGMDVEGVQIGLAQMMVDEAARQLDFLRRKANLIAAQQEAANVAQVQSILSRTRNGG